MKKLLNLWPYAVMIVAAISFFGWLNSCQEVDAKEAEIKQMEAFHNSKLETLKAEGETLSRRVAALTDMNDRLDNIIKNQNEDIISKNRTILNLSSLVGSGEGDPIIEIDTSCVGLFLTYRDSVQTHTTYIEVKVDTPRPHFTYKVDVVPFGLTTYLTRDENGIWKGYAVPDSSFQDFIHVTGLDVEVAKDEFREFYDDTDVLKIGLGAGIGSSPTEKELLLSLDPAILLNEEHQFQVDIPLNSDWWFVRYNYFFFNW